MVWVFVFYTCTPEDVDDWSGIEFQKIGSWAYRVVKPLWIGNVDRAGEYMQKYIDHIMSEDRYFVNWREMKLDDLTEIKNI